MKPDIQQYFDFKYVEGELHIYIRKEMVKALGWTDKDLDMSFGGIKRMNSFKGAHLSIHPVDKDQYQHPWYDQPRTSRQASQPESQPIRYPS